VIGPTVAAQPVRRLPLWVAALFGAAVLGIVGAALTHAYAAHGSTDALPLLHGQASWPPGARPAPASAPRGMTAMVVFLGRGCAPCVAELRRIVRRLPAPERPALVVAPASATAAYGVARGRRLLLLLDRRGDERTGYAFPLAPAFVAGDLRTLAQGR
jgi:hypothetical protein